MFTDFRKLRFAVESIGVNYAAMTGERAAILWQGEIIEGKEQLILSSQGLFEILPDGSVIRVIVHAPQGPYQSRDSAELDLMEDPDKGWHKFHVLWCSSVEQWRSRLRKTNRDDGRFTYPLFWRDRTEYKPELRDGGRSLLLCRNCSKMLKSLSINADVHAFDVRGFLSQRQLGSSFDGLSFTSDFDLVPNVYADDWGRISSGFKSMRNWTCERCFIDLASVPKLLHAHHRDHHKANNSVFNLQALCIKCHAEEHPGNSSLNGSPDLVEFNRLFAR